MTFKWRGALSCVAVGLLSEAALSGCGSDAGTKAGDQTPAASETRLVAATFEQWADAQTEGRFEDACALQTQALQDEMADLAREFAPNRATCAFLLEVSSPEEPEPREKKIESIEVNGSTATGVVGMHTWRFEKVSDEWRISYLN